ncbi:MAG: hypothetical protein Q9228_002691 [Teloschistes exilis]
MSGVESNPPVSQESKSAKKKKAKAEAAAKVSTVQPGSEPEAAKSPVENVTNGVDGPNESPYMKELNKNIRSIKKKLAACQKVDSIIAENPNQNLDELLAARKINQDQKVQVQKKPSLQASLAQVEEQVAQYRQFDEEYQRRLAAEKSALETSHKAELDRVKETATSAAKAESEKEAKDNLLVLSKFLRAAAAKRQGGDETSPENRAFEGALLLVYGGEAGAVAAMESLIAGSDEKVPTVDQVPSEYTYKQVRDLAFGYAPYAAEEAWAEDVAQSEPAPPAAEDSNPSTDPTVAHAGLTELDTSAEPTSNGLAHHVETPSVPEASNIDAGAANAAASDPNWEAKLSASAEAGPDGWVQVPRDPAETDTGTAATPAAMTSTQSWAEDVPSEAQGVAVHVIKAKIAEADEAGVEAGVIEAEKGATAAVADFVATVVEEKEGIADVAEVDEEEIVAAVMLLHDDQSYGSYRLPPISTGPTFVASPLLLETTRQGSHLTHATIHEALREPASCLVDTYGGLD